MIELLLAIPFKIGEGYEICGIFWTPIQRNCIFETPIEQNVIFETPIQQIDIFNTPMKKIAFRDLHTTKNAFLSPLHTFFFVLTTLQSP